MIQTRINKLLQVVFNESDSAFSTEDVAHALVRTEQLGQGKCAVIWDLRKTDADQFGQELTAWLVAALRSKAIVPSLHCRAIVVKDPTSRERIEHLLGEIPVPWRWIVTTSLGEAVTWVGHHHPPAS